MPMTSTTSHNPNANIRTVDKKSSTTTTNTTNSSIIGSIPTSTLGLAAAATAERIQKMTQATASSTNSVTTGGGERKKSRVPAKVPLKDINEFLMCQLCFGYLIEATAIVECQDTFCKSCILKYLETNSSCPICEVLLNQAKPHSSLRSDETLQKLVYKLVPGLYITELRKRKEFVSKFSRDEEEGTDEEEEGEEVNSTSTAVKEVKPKTNGESTCTTVDILSSMELKDGETELVFLSPEDSVSLSLEYFKSPNLTLPSPDEDTTITIKPAPSSSPDKQAGTTQKQQQLQRQRQPSSSSHSHHNQDLSVTSSSSLKTIAEKENESQIQEQIKKSTCSDNKANDRRYLQCPAAVSVGLLKKFIRMKYGLSDDYRVDLLYNGDCKNNLENDLTLLDLAFIYKWKKADPMCFHYRIFDRPFKTLTARPGSKRSFPSLMDHEPPNDDDTASGPSTRSSLTSPAPAKLSRFNSSDSTRTDTSSSSSTRTGKGQPKGKQSSMDMEEVKDEDASGKKSDETKSIESLKPESKPCNTNNNSLTKNVEHNKPINTTTVPLLNSTSCGQTTTNNMPKIPPLIVSSPTRDATSPLKISLSKSSASSSTSSPEGKTHHHHHHHHHKHHRHHKEKHKKHSKNKSKDKDKNRDKDKSSKSKEKEKRKEEKEQGNVKISTSSNISEHQKHQQQQLQPQHNNNNQQKLFTKDPNNASKETRYKYNAHPNPSQSQTISVKAGKYPLTNNTGIVSSSSTSAATSINNNGLQAQVSIGRLDSNVNKKLKNTGAPNTSNAFNTSSGSTMGSMKKSTGIIAGKPEGISERRASSSSNASSSSQASLTVSLKTSNILKLPAIGNSSSTNNNNNNSTTTSMMSISKEILQQQQQQKPNIPDSVHLQVPKSVTLIPVNPNSGQVLGKQQQRNTGSSGGGGGNGRMSNAQTFTHPITNKSLHQITVTEVPPPTKSGSPNPMQPNSGNNNSNNNNSITIERSTGINNSSSLQLHKQFNGPGSMEITKIYCDKSSNNSSSTSKLFDSQSAKKLKGLDISISTSSNNNNNNNNNSNNNRKSFDNSNNESHTVKNSITLSKATGLPKIPGVSILPQSMAGIQQQQHQQKMNTHSMSISTTSGKIKDKSQLAGNNRLSITTIQQQQQQPVKIPMSGTNNNKSVLGNPQNPGKIRSMGAPNSIRRSSSPNSCSSTESLTTGKMNCQNQQGNIQQQLKKQQQQHLQNASRITPSPPSNKTEQIISASKLNRRSSIEITVANPNNKNKIKRPFESTFPRNMNNNSGGSGSNKSSSNTTSLSSTNTSPPGKREKLTSNDGGNRQQQRTRTSECPLDLSGKPSRPSSASDYDSSNSSIDRPSTPIISITPASAPSSSTKGRGSSPVKPHHQSSTSSASGERQSSNKSQFSSSSAQTISSIAKNLSQKQQQQQIHMQKQQHNKEHQKSGSRNNAANCNVSSAGPNNNLGLSPPIMSPMPAHSPPGGFNPLGNLLTLSNAAAHLHKMNNHHHHSQHPLSSLAVAAAAATAGGPPGYCQNLLRPPMPQQQSPPCLSGTSPPISPSNANTSGIPPGLLSHFNHQMNMNLMNSPLLMNSAASSFLDPTSPASLFCARMGFPQPNPSSPLNHSPNSLNPFFSPGSPLTRPPHPSSSSASSPNSHLRIPNVSSPKQKSPPISSGPNNSQHHFQSSMSPNSSKLSANSSSSSSSNSHSPKSSSSSSSHHSNNNKPLKLNGTINSSSQPNTFIAPSAVAPVTKAQAQSAKNAIPNVMKISNFLPTTKSLSANTNATITSSCGDLMLNDLHTTSALNGPIISSMSTVNPVKEEVNKSTKESHHSHYHHSHYHKNLQQSSSSSSPVGPGSDSTKPVVETMAITSTSFSLTSKSITSTSTSTVATTTTTGSTTSVTASSNNSKGISGQCTSSSSSSAALLKKPSKSTNAKYICSPGGILLVPPENDQKPAASITSKENMKETEQRSSSLKNEVINEENNDSINQNVGLGALGIALGLIPVERKESKEIMDKDIPQLTVTSSSCSSSIRTTQHQNLAVRHIPNPSLIFSRQRSLDNNTNVTPNNQIPSEESKILKEEKVESSSLSPAATSVTVTLPATPKDSDSNDDDDDDDDAQTKTNLLPKMDKVEAESEKEEDQVEVSENKTVEINQVVKVKEEVLETDDSETFPPVNLEVEEEGNVAHTTTKNVDVESEVEEEAEDHKEKSEEYVKEENIVPKELEIATTAAPKDEINVINIKQEVSSDLDTFFNGIEKIQMTTMTSSDNHENSSSASEIEMPTDQVLEVFNENEMEESLNDDISIQEDGQDEKNGEETLEEVKNLQEEVQIETESMQTNEESLESAVASSTEEDEPISELQEHDDEDNIGQVNDIEDETMMEIVEEEDRDEDVEMENDANPGSTELAREEDQSFLSVPVSEDAFTLLKSTDITVTDDDSTNSINTVPTIESSCDDDERMEIDLKENEEEDNEPSVEPEEESSAIKLSVEDLVNQVEDESFTSSSNNEGKLSIDEANLIQNIKPIMAANSEPESETIKQSPSPILIQNGSTSQLENVKADESIPDKTSIQIPLTIITSPGQNNQLTEREQTESLSPTKSLSSPQLETTLRPNTLSIASPLSKTIRSGSCSPSSPLRSDLKKMENLEKVAAGLLASATNINNNNNTVMISPVTSSTTEASNCDLTISTTTSSSTTNSNVPNDNSMSQAIVTVNSTPAVTMSLSQVSNM